MSDEPQKTEVYDRAKIRASADTLLPERPKPGGAKTEILMTTTSFGATDKTQPAVKAMPALAKPVHVQATQMIPEAQRAEAMATQKKKRPPIILWSVVLLALVGALVLGIFLWVAQSNAGKPQVAIKSDIETQVTAEPSAEPSTDPSAAEPSTDPGAAEPSTAEPAAVAPNRPHPSWQGASVGFQIKRSKSMRTRAGTKAFTKALLGSDAAKFMEDSKASAVALAFSKYEVKEIDGEVAISVQCSAQSEGINSVASAVRSTEVPASAETLRVLKIDVLRACGRALSKKWQSDILSAPKP